MFDKVEPEHLDILMALCDGIIHGCSPEVIAPVLHPDFPKERLQEYLDSYKKPSEIARFRDYLGQQLNLQCVSSVQQLVLLCKVLGSRLLSPAITKTTTLITEMSEQEREAVLKDWRDSPLEQKRKLFRVVHSLAMSTFVKMAPELHYSAIGYAGKESRESLEGQSIDPFVYSFVEKPHDSNIELVIPEPVLIVGSGAGAGVVVSTLAEAGVKSVVLEKGQYFKNDEFTMNDEDGTAALYEQGGALLSKSQQILILAGSTFGGGTAVNWSACIPAPFKVRKEWYDDHGLDWVASDEWDRCVDYVWKKMGASTENIKHSVTNTALLEGAEKLGYAHKPVNQNTGGIPLHDCGMCHLGCRFGVKQGSANCFFRPAAEENLVKFMQQVKVEKVLHKHGKAYGVLCTDTATGVVFKITGPQKIVVAGGSLHTPVLLQKSGFANKHIGANLKLHPVTVAFADWGRESNLQPHAKSIMTSVITEVDDFDGKGHGCKIESMLHAPFIESVFFPWDGSDKARINMGKYNNLSIVLLITRDKGAGSVSYDRTNGALNVEYDVAKFDRDALLEGFLCAADVLYIEGAKEIFSPQSWTPRFASEKPKEQRSITDPDYVKWRAEAAAIPFDTYGSPYGSAHQMSSCRTTGKGSGHGACDQNGRLFECKNVYVADASTMPTASGANPMITTMAFARHIALGLIKDLPTAAKL
ncbi:hypothetical protein DICA0_E30504 [Diutina catenulata]